MKPGHIKLIGVLLLVAVALYLPRFFGGEGEGSFTIEEGFVFSTADPVTRVDVTDLAAGSTITLERGLPEWTVDGLRVDMRKVEELVGVLGHVASDVIVARNPENHESLGVSETTGRRIEVYTEAGGPFSFHLGNRDLAAGGYFVRTPGTDDVFRLDGAIGGVLSRERDAWRERVIARIDTAAVRDIIVKREAEEYVLRRDETGWAIDGSPADEGAVAAMLTMLPSIAISGFASDDDAAAADFAVADAELDVFAEGGTDVTDRELVLGIRFILDPEAGDWLAQLVDGSEVYRFAPFSVRRLLPELAQLVPEE